MRFPRATAIVKASKGLSLPVLAFLDIVFNELSCFLTLCPLMTSEETKALT